MHFLREVKVGLEECTCLKEKAKEGGRKRGIVATPMIGQGILRGVQTMGHCGGKDVCISIICR